MRQKTTTAVTRDGRHRPPAYPRRIVRPWTNRHPADHSPAHTPFRGRRVGLPGELTVEQPDMRVTAAWRRHTARAPYRRLFARAIPLERSRSVTCWRTATIAQADGCAAFGKALAAMRQAMTLTFSAWGPFWPWVMSNSTFCPSSRLR